MRLSRLREKLLQNIPAGRQAQDIPSRGLYHATERFSSVLEQFPEMAVESPLQWRESQLASSGPLVFWDVETCGLGDAAIFLIGLLSYDGSASDSCWRLDLLLAEDPSQEPQLLRAAAEALGSARSWITFNGRSFDLPRLRKRAFRYDAELPGCDRHLDLLHEVRRRWKGRLPNCHLSTVERRLLGLERAPGEVSGQKVPEHYRRYIETGDRRWIAPVLSHNRQDVLALALLHFRLLDGE